jgi:hypothetical protein
VVVALGKLDAKKQDGPLHRVDGVCPLVLLLYSITSIKFTLEYYACQADQSSGTCALSSIRSMPVEAKLFRQQQSQRP